MKSAIITGVSGNLGQAVAKKFLAEGFHITGTVIPNDPVKIDINDSNFETAVANLMDEQSASQFVADTIAKQKTIDAAILTVGGFAMGSIADTSSADILKQHKLNFETAYHVARPVFVQMLKQNSGRIFLVGSRTASSMSFSKGMTAYGLSKSLIFRLAELMNLEAKGKNVVTNVVVPSTIDTPENRKSMPDADFSKWVKPEKIAEVIYFYASTEADLLREGVIKVYGEA
jgi:NAD(P)-dependent dehydrogenase (short-subunit alcohol dehydrogenase family)